MALWQRIKSWFGFGVKASAEMYDRFKSWFEPVNIFTKVATGSLATNETIFSAVSRLSNSLASLPLKQYRDFKEERTPIADLLAVSPNPNMTGFDFIRTLEACRNTYGNGYALKDYDTRYQVRALWILDPGRVTPLIEQTTRELWYRVQGDDGGFYYVHNMDMLHVKHIHTMGYTGISPLDVLRNTIDFDTKVKEFSLDQIDGAIKASFILQMATSLGEEKKKQVLESFKAFYKDNGGVLIQEHGVKIDPISREYIDTKVFETERITRTRVASVYNMPVSMLGETDGDSYASREQMALEYVRDTLTPICVQYEKEFARKLLTAAERRRGFYWKFNVNAYLRGDMKTRGEFYTKGVRTALFTPNEVRAWEELPPMPGGEFLYVSRDMVRIDQQGRVPNDQKTA
jgi:HK97 family phage portal protein